MLSFGKSRKGVSSGYYFKYYTNDSLYGGQWYGKGAELLGLSGAVTKDEFVNIADGFSKDRSVSLVQNAGHEKKLKFLDLCFSVPKSVSAAWVAGSEQTKREIEACISDAACETLSRAENSCGISREGKGGKTWSKASLAFALFFHFTSREQDPQLHVHALLMMTGVRENGRPGAVHTRPFYEQRLNGGYFFLEKLASLLEARLRYVITPEKGGFHIEGTPKPLCEELSKRSGQVKKDLAKTGHSGGKAAAVAAIKTRKHKRKAELSELLKGWRTVIASHGFSEEKIQRIDPERAKERTTPYVIREAANRGEGEEHSKSKQKEHQSSESSKQERAQGNKQNEGAAQDQTRTDEGKTHTQEKTGSEKRAKQKNQKPVDPKEAAKKAERMFAKEFRRTINRIFPEKQTEETTEKIAYALAKKYGVPREKIPGYLKQIGHTKNYGPLRVEWRKIHWKAPAWSSFSRRIPRLAITKPKRKWGKIRASVGIWGVGPWKKEIRIQQRKVFPSVPDWNPASKLSIPAIRIARKRKPQKEAPKPQRQHELRL